jgi:hypothetical protein
MKVNRNTASAEAVPTALMSPLAKAARRCHKVRAAEDVQ